MKSLFTLAFLFVFLLPKSISAQEKLIARNGFQEGFRAVQFGIGSNFRLTNFDDSHFSYLKFRSENNAFYLRGSFNIEYQSQNNAFTYSNEFPENESNDRENFRDQDGDSFTSNLKVSLGRLKYLNTESDLLPYLSYGGIIGVGLNSSNSTLNEGTAGSYLQQIDNASENNQLIVTPIIGISSGFGVEFFVSKNISIFTNSGFELIYYYNSREDKSSYDRFDEGDLIQFGSNKQLYKNHIFSLRSTGVLIGLTAYF